MRITLMIGHTEWDTTELPTAEVTNECMTRMAGPYGEVQMFWGKDPTEPWKFRLNGVLPLYREPILNRLAELTPGKDIITEVRTFRTAEAKATTDKYQKEREDAND